MKNPNRQKTGECSPTFSKPKQTVNRPLKSPTSHISFTQNNKVSEGASLIKHEKEMERKKPRPIKELKEEYENGTA